LRFTISGKHTEVPESFRLYAEQKTAKLPRYYSSIDRIEVLVEFGVTAGTAVEIIARSTHNDTFIGTATGDDPKQCVDAAVRKLERQLTRKKTRERNNKHTHISSKDIGSVIPKGRQ
jgi:ribosomal subunit interface protein